MKRGPDGIIIRPATMADHKTLCAIARTHAAGQGFTNGLMFSGQVHYDKGWLRAATFEDCILGFTCVRHKTRSPKTMLYYVIVDPRYRKGNIMVTGVGQALLDDLMEQTPHRCIELSCLKDNAPALAFYKKNGFEICGESLKGKGFHLEKHW